MGRKKIVQTFDEVYTEFAKKIFRFVYFRVSDHELAEDITEDTFVKYWKVLSTHEEIKNSKALLYTISRGLIIDEYRKKGKRKIIEIDSVDERLLLQIDTTEDKLSVQQEIDEVLQGLKKIKKEYQEVILFHYLEDLTIPEIAHMLGKKENAVRVLLHRALTALKKFL